MWAFHAKCMFADPFRPPTPAIVSETATKPTRSARFCKGAKSMPLIKTTLEHPKVVRTWCGCTALTSGCAPHPALFRSFPTSQRPKMVRDRYFLNTFDLRMCFAPQRRALFERLNYHQCSGHEVLLTFWLPHPLLATAICAFSRTQLPKLLRAWGVFGVLTSKSPSCHNGVQFSIFHPTRWLHTRHFSKPTCRPSGATNHWKNAMFCDFSTFSWTLLFLLALSLLFFSPLTLSLLCLFLFWLFLFSDSSHHDCCICPKSEVWPLNF